MRLLPRSLFGRLVLVLVSGLTVAQFLGAAINFAEQDRLALEAIGTQSAQRIADTVKLFDSLDPKDRQPILRVLSVPPYEVTLAATPRPTKPTPAEDSAEVEIFSQALRQLLGNDKAITVALSSTPLPIWPPALARGLHADRLGATPETRRLAVRGLLFQTQVRLQDGSWAIFDTRIPQEGARLSARLLLALVVLLVAVLGLSLIAVRLATRPLIRLAQAAEELGHNIDRPPLPEVGPTEVAGAARAFNTMQMRLARFIHDRTRMLTAMSHDLKTPITRMRLRADLLEDEELRGRFEKDLKEMEHMVTETLEFLRGMGGKEVPQPIDMMALIESLQADNEEMGREVSVQGSTNEPYVGIAPLLKRCLANLIDNAVLYGKHAHIFVEDSPTCLCVRIEDDGPGLPDESLEQVFEPFYRLESSRNRGTGGTGLGLTIARNIAQTHGGTIQLCNRQEGGLEAAICLPRIPR